MPVSDERREQLVIVAVFIVLKQPGRVWYQITAENKSSAIILLFFTFRNALRCRKPRKQCLIHILIIFFI